MIFYIWIQNISLPKLSQMYVWSHLFFIENNIFHSNLYLECLIVIWKIFSNFFENMSNFLCWFLFYTGKHLWYNYGRGTNITGLREEKKITESGTRREMVSTSMVAILLRTGLDDGADNLCGSAYWVCCNSHVALCSQICLEGGGFAVEINGAQGVGGVSGCGRWKDENHHFYGTQTGTVKGFAKVKS